MTKIRVVSYDFKPEAGAKMGVPESERSKVGVIAQEIAKVIPEAVKQNGEFWTVDDVGNLVRTLVFLKTTTLAKDLLRKCSSCQGAL